MKKKVMVRLMFHPIEGLAMTDKQSDKAKEPCPSFADILGMRDQLRLTSHIQRQWNKLMDMVQAPGTTLPKD